MAEFDGVIKMNGFDNLAYQKDQTDPGKPGENSSTDQTKDEETPDQRDQWGNSIEFLMSCISMSVGLGNIWRFPFTANNNGGGAFLIPYLVVLILVGRPMYYMEMALGQFSSRGTIKMYEKLSPVFKAIGYGQVIGSTCVATYYCSIMAVTLFYFIHSFTSDFPWSKCEESWRADYTCIDKFSNDTNATNTTSSSALYFKKVVLKEIDDISDGIGTPDWILSLLLLASWIVTFLVSIKGVKSSGKASYFLALFPYVIMITLLIRASTLEGAKDGMFYFIDTDWPRLLDARVWYAAVTQCFFSLNVGFGSIIMLSSYNSFSHNINRDAFIITTLDTFTSLLSGITIFGILGNLAYETNKKPSEVILGGGTALAFVSYPEAISKFDAVPWLFALLFFFMLFVLGIGSLAALQGVLNTAIRDAFPHIAPWIVSLCTAAGCFLIGLLYVTPGGQYVLDLVDHFGGTFIIFLFTIFEVMVINWVYGLDQFCLDLEFMTKQKVGIYWRMCWGLFMPVLLIVIFIYFLATLEPLTYGIYKLEFPIGLTVFGWLIVAIGVLQAIIWLSYYLWTNREYPPKEMIKRTFSTHTWGPVGAQRTKEWKKFKEDTQIATKSDEGSWIYRKTKILLGK